MSEWTSINSGCLPPSETTVLIWNAGRHQPEVAFIDPDDGDWKSQIDGDTIAASDITHWSLVDAPSRLATGGAS